MLVVPTATDVVPICVGEAAAGVEGVSTSTAGELLTPTPSALEVLSEPPSDVISVGWDCVPVVGVADMMGVPE